MADLYFSTMERLNRRTKSKLMPSKRLVRCFAEKLKALKGSSGNNLMTLSKMDQIEIESFRGNVLLSFGAENIVEVTNIDKRLAMLR